MRVLLEVAYDGTNYHGWQIQEGQDTVEGCIRESLSALLRMQPGDVLETIGASRTDAGVHALGNICVFDCESTIPPDRFSYALNDLLPRDIRIVSSKETEPDFNPRFGAKNKTYEYRIYNGKIHLPTKRLYSHHYRGKIDEKSMDEAAKNLVGEHDFTSLASVHAQTSSYVRTIYDCHVRREDEEIVISVTGNGFLYNMVRIISGTLLDVGIGKKSPDEIPKIIRAKDRKFGGPTLPPQGLCLMRIKYQ